MPRKSIPALTCSPSRSANEETKKTPSTGYFSNETAVGSVPILSYQQSVIARGPHIWLVYTLAHSLDFGFSVFHSGLFGTEATLPGLLFADNKFLETALKIRAGYDIAFQCYQDTPMVLMLSVHPSRQPDLLTEHHIRLSNGIDLHDYLDAFGNTCTRLVAPPGLLEIRNDFIIRDSGEPDAVVADAPQWDVSALPDEALMYLLGSRYCDTEKLSRI